MVFGNNKDWINRMLILIAFIISGSVIIFKVLIPALIKSIQGVQHFDCISGTYTQNDAIIIFFSSFTFGVCSIHFLLYDYKSKLKHELDLSTKAAEIDSLNGGSISNFQNEEIKREIFMKALKGTECKVIKLLLKYPEINQTELAVRGNTPKSTLSRTLANLERRGLIIRYKNGMSKMVKLSENFQEINKPSIIIGKDKPALDTMVLK